MTESEEKLVFQRLSELKLDVLLIKVIIIFDIIIKSITFINSI